MDKAKFNEMIDVYHYSNRLPLRGTVIAALDVKPKLMERKGIIERVTDKLVDLIRTFDEDSHPDRLPTGNTLSIIANRSFVGPYHDQALLGLEENESKSFLGAIYTELTAKSPVARPPGNNCCGNDDVKRISNKGGHGLRTLNTHYGHTLFQLACRFGFDTANAAGMKTRLGTIGALADDMLIEAKLASEDSRDNSARIQATRLEKYKTQLTDQDFGSTTAMLNFEIQRWTDPAADAESWIGLAENTVAATSEQDYFLIVRRYLSSFFFEASRLREADLAAKVWAHLSHAVTSFSRDAIWMLIRNQELSDLGITHKAVRAARREKTIDPFSHINERRGIITLNPKAPPKVAITTGNLGFDKISDGLKRGFSDSRIEGEISDSSVRAVASDILDDGDELNISAGRDIYAGIRLGAGVEFDFGQPFARLEYRFRQTPKLAPNQIFNSAVAVPFLDGRQDLLSRHAGPEHRLGVYLGPQQQNIGGQHQPQLEHHNRRQ